MTEQTERRPLILITNDDGVFAPGIAALGEALEDLAEVIVVAPDRNQSAVSHKITLHSPLRVTEVRERWFSVEGTPTDCVYLGVVDLLDRPPDLIVSGINEGPNLGFDVHYSGTVAAAMEGSLLGVPSFAVSLVDREGTFEAAAQFSQSLARVVLRTGLPKNTTLSVNVPPKPSSFEITRLGRREYAHSVHRREDPRGQTYFWIGGRPKGLKEEPGSDCDAVDRGLISVTPLGADLTDGRSMSSSLSELLADEWG